MPIGFGDRLDTKQTFLAALFDDLRPSLAQPLAIDPATDHDMGDMDAVRPVFSSHALRDRA